VTRKGACTSASVIRTRPPTSLHELAEGDWDSPLNIRKIVVTTAPTVVASWSARAPISSNTAPRALPRARIKLPTRAAKQAAKAPKTWPAATHVAPRGSRTFAQKRLAQGESTAASSARHSAATAEPKVLPAAARQCPSGAKKYPTMVFQAQAAASAIPWPQGRRHEFQQRTKSQSRRNCPHATQPCQQARTQRPTPTQQL